jgi:hypothetical protein
VREWLRVNGGVHLKIIAGEALHPKLKQLARVGLPFGAKSRLVLAHLNTEALRAGSPKIETEGSLRAFVGRLRLDEGGRTMGTVRDQLARLSAATIRLGMVRDERAMTANTSIVKGFELWPAKGDDRQQVLWPSVIWRAKRWLSAEQR